jgi:hypothetical protein
MKDKRKGNQFWRNIDPKDLGRNPKYRSPEELWDDVKGYFDTCDNSPLVSTETRRTDRNTEKKETQHRVPYTWEGLYVHLGVCNLEHYKTKEAFSEIITHIGNIIYNQKFTGAAAGLFNSNIIARDLGLKDKSEQEVSGSIKTIEVVSVPKKDI